MPEKLSEAPPTKRPVLRVLAVGALLIALAILAALGGWQGQKFLKKRVVFGQMEERLDLPAVDVDSATELTEDKDFRHVKLEGGTLELDKTAVVTRRFHKHRPGNFVYTPYRFGDGTTVLVQRGWIPQGDPTAILESATLPAHDNLVGFLYTPERRVSDDLARQQFEAGEIELTDTPGLGEADSALLYDVLEGDGPPRANSVVVLSDRFAETWKRNQLPEPAWQHITQPYLTPAMHLGYTVTWWGAGLVLIWVFWAGWTGRLDPSYRRRKE